MNGMTYGPHINDMYGNLNEPRKIGHFVIAIDPARFAGGAMLERTIDDVIADLRAEGEVLFPGEPEYLEQRNRTEHGIPIDSEALADMNAWSAKLGVAALTPKGPA